MKWVIRFLAYVLILVGICTIWEIADVAMYGNSQHSAADAIAAVIIANCLDTKIWRTNHVQ